MKKKDKELTSDDIIKQKALELLKETKHRKTPLEIREEAIREHKAPIFNRKSNYNELRYNELQKHLHL